MKSQQELQDRIRELVKESLKQRLEEAHVRLPHLCTHNHRHVLDSRKTVLGEANEQYNRIGDARHLPLAQTMGLCMLGAEDPEQWKGDICDDPIDAQRCPYFSPRESPQIITEEFTEGLKDRAWVEKNLPVVAALLWVAEESTVPANEPEPEAAPEPEPEPEPAPLVIIRPSWWKRMIARIFGA